MDPPLYVQRGLNTSADRVPGLRKELKQKALEDQKKRLVDTFYSEVNRALGLRPEGWIDFSQFGIDADGETLYWRSDDKNILISARKGGFRFLALSSLAKEYGQGGTDAVRRSLGVTDYKSGTSRLSSSAEKALRQADKALPSNIEIIKLHLPGAADSACRSPEQAEATLTTINDYQIDTAWVTQAKREHASLEKARAGVRNELANNLAKLSDVMIGNQKLKNTLSGSDKN